MQIKYKGWGVDLDVTSSRSKLIISCTIVGEEIIREYDLFESITKIEFEGDYLTLYIDGSDKEYYYCNFSSSTELIIDKYSNDEFEDSLGCYDFYDDYIW